MLLSEAGDNTRIEKLLKNPSTKNVTELVEQVILNVVLNDSFTFKVFVKLHTSQFSGEKLISDTEKLVSAAVFSGKPLSSIFELSSTSKVSVSHGSPTVDYPSKVDSVSISMNDIELPLKDGKALLSEKELGTFIKSNQEYVLKYKKDSISLSKTLFIIERFYAAFARTVYPSKWIPKVKAANEVHKWKMAAHILGKLQSIVSMNDKSKIGDELDKLTEAVKTSILTKKEICIPITWEQEYPAPFLDKDINSVIGITPKKDKNEQEKETDKSPRHQKDEPKKKEEEEEKPKFPVVLWVLFTPESEKDKYTLTFVNTASVLSSLFPKCTQAHVPKQSRKFQAAFAYEKKESPSGLGNIAEMGMDIDPTTIAVSSAGLHPGSVGTVNKLDFHNIPVESLDPIILSLFVMQLLPLQRQVEGDLQDMASKVSSLASLFSGDDNNENDDETKDESIINAKNILKQKKTIGNAVSAVLRTRMDTAAYLPFEEDICKHAFNGRSLVDGELLEGHSIHILESIFGTLQSIGKCKPDDESVYPLVPDISICDSFFLLERFTNSTDDFMRTTLLRSIFLIRSNNRGSNTDLLKELGQRVFAKAMANPGIFGDTQIDQIRGLESLKSILDGIISPLHGNSFNRIARLDTSINVNCEGLYNLPNIIPCTRNVTEELPSVEPLNLFWPKDNPDKLRNEWNTYTYSMFDHIWKAWLKEAEDMHRCRDLSTLRRLVQSMIDSVPNDWDIMSAQFMNEINNDPDPKVTRQLWINRWSLILLRLGQLYCVGIFERLGNNLKESSESKKFGITPEEMLGLVKINVLLDKLYCFPQNDDIQSVAPHRPPMAWEFFFECLTSDHYLHTFSAEQNEYLQKFLDYIDSRISEDSLTTAPQGWVHDLNSNFANLMDDDIDFGGVKQFDTTILNGIVDRAQAFYGGDIPNIDSYGNKNLDKILSVALSREKERFSYVSDDKVKKAKVIYNNLRVPDNKKQPKASGIHGMIIANMDESVNGSREIEYDFQWESATLQDRPKIKADRQRAHTWLTQSYHRVSYPSYFKEVQYWLQDHVKDLKLYDIENILQQRLAGMDISSLDFKTAAKAKNQAARINARDSFMLEISAGKGFQIMNVRRLVISVLTKLNGFKNFLQRFSQYFTHLCTCFAVKQFISSKSLNPISPDYSELQKITEKIANEPSLQSLTDCLTALLSDGSLELLNISKDEQENIQTLTDSLQTWWCGEFAIYRNVEQLQPLFCSLVGEQTSKGREYKLQNGKLISIRFPNIPTQSVGECIELMSKDFFAWQEAQYESKNARRAFDDDRNSLHRHMVLISPPLKAFWPPSLLGLFTITNLTRFVMDFRNEIFLKSYSSAFKPGAKVLATAAKSAIVGLFTDSKIISERQIQERFTYLFIKNFRESLIKCELPEFEYFSWDLLGSISKISKGITGSLGLQWFLGIRVDSESILPILSREKDLIPPSSSHYTHGVTLPKTVRSQLVRGGICNAYTSDGITSISLLAESVPIIPCLDGEIDLCQEMRIDHLATLWVETHAFNASTNQRFFKWNLNFGNWQVLGNVDDQNIPVLFHGLRSRVTEDKESMIYAHWERDVACSAPTLINAVLGELSLDRINYLLAEPSIQRVFETKLFRPTMLPFVCGTKPQFLNALVSIFARSIRIQKGTSNIAGELYLRYLLYRISNELKCIERFSFIESVRERIQNDTRIEFEQRLEHLYNQIMGPYFAKNKHGIEDSQIKQLHSLTIHKYYLYWIRIKYGYNVDVNDPIAPKLVASFSCYRSGVTGLGGSEVDLHELQSFGDWMFSLFQNWKSDLIQNDLPTLRVSALLFPTAAYFLHNEDADLVSSLNRCTWTCDNYPTFSSTFGEHTITVEPASGYLFLNGTMRTFVRYEHAIHETYQRFFGMRLLPCSFWRKNQWDIYQCKILNSITGTYDRYTIKANRGDLYIFRETIISDSKKRWYQYIPGGLISSGEPLPDGYPGFISGSDAWLRYNTGKKTTGIALFSFPEDNPENCVIHHCATFQKIPKQDILKFIEIRRYPSMEVVKYFKFHQIPKALQFEHPLFIEFGNKKIHLPRFKLSFTYHQETQSWLSDDYPGYNLSDGFNVDPFGDGSSYWLTLEKRSSFGVSFYLLLAAAKPLLPYPPSLGPGIGMANYRHGTRCVWLDHEEALTTNQYSYFTLTIDLEYPSLLKTSSATGKCWLALLYLAKRDYYNSFTMINNLNFDTNLTAEQLHQYHNILHWHDNNHNASMIKLKIIAALAKNDPNIFCNAESEEKNQPVSMKSITNIITGNKPSGTKQIGRFTKSLLGMTQEQFFDLYLVALEEQRSDFKPLSESTRIPVGVPVLETVPGGAVVHLTRAEWSYINRALNRWPKGIILRAIGSTGGFENTRVVQNATIRKPTIRIADVYNKIVGNKDSIVEIFGLSLKDVAFDILQNNQSTSKDSSLLLKTIPIFLGTPSRYWTKYFVTIYQRLISLKLDSTRDSKELQRWKFLLVSTPYSGDRISRLSRILLYKVACIVEDRNADKLKSFSKKLIATRTKFAKKVVGVNTFGIRKNRDKEFLRSAEEVLIIIDSALPFSEVSSFDRKGNNFLSRFDSESSDSFSELISNFGELPPISEYLDPDIDNDSDDEEFNEAIKNSISSYLDEVAQSQAKESINDIRNSGLISPDKFEGFNLPPNLIDDKKLGVVGSSLSLLAGLLTTASGNIENFTSAAAALGEIGEIDESVRENLAEQFKNMNIEERISQGPDAIPGLLKDGLGAGLSSGMTSLGPIQSKFLQFQQNQEILVLEQLLQKRYIESHKKPPLQEDYYDSSSSSLPELKALIDKYLKVTKTKRNENLWKERSDLLFNERHYDQPHHISAAKLMQDGFDKAWQIPELTVEFKEPEEETVTSLKKALYSIRASLEAVESEFVELLYSILRRPGLVTGSILCADQAVPLSVVLNAWENNQLERLEECYGCDILSHETKTKLDTVIEAIDIKICWRYHIGNILKKLDEATSCSHPLEKKATLETIYHLFNEELCYTITEKSKPVQNRKILGISRVNGFLIRKKQINITNILLKNPNQAIQAALGLGKSSVIVPLTTSALANGCHCIWIMCPLTDKPETIQRCESVRSILNHPLLIFHFENDGTTLQTNINEEHISDDLYTQEENEKKSNIESPLFPPYRLDNEVHLRELYYDLLRITIEKGLVITTRESLLFFVDSYEQLWLSRARFKATENVKEIEKCDILLNWFSKFFPFFKKHCKAIMDEIDVILQANVKVNIALSDMAKINRDTLSLAVKSVEILLDPNEYISIENKENNSIENISLPHIIPLMNNCQAACTATTKHLIRSKLAEKLGEYEFGFDIEHHHREHYLAFILCSNKEKSEIFYNLYITGTENHQCHPQAANIVRLRELLGGSFATLFKRHNYSLGRMFTNDNKDDVGPYSAANTPLKNSHLSSEYDWVWALAANYAMQGITLAQFCRYVNQVRTEAMAQCDDLEDIQLYQPQKKQDKSRAEEFEQLFGISVLTVTKHIIPSLLEKINDVGDWEEFEQRKIKVCIDYLNRPKNEELKNRVIKYVPEIISEEEISPHHVQNIASKLFHSKYSSENWPELLQYIQSHGSVGKLKERESECKFKQGIKSRLDFLVNFVNLTYYPSFIEGNATTIVHLFESVCGFSGTMEVPYSLPQLVFRTSDPDIMRDRAIDGIILSRFLSYSIGVKENNINSDTTKYVDDAAEDILRKRLNQDIKSKGIRKFIKNNTREVIIASYDCQAIVDGGALLDVDPQDVIDEFVEDSDLIQVIQDPGKIPIKTIRWKEQGEWMTIDIHNKRKQLQHHRAEPLKLGNTITFYDQQHSRGTDAKLAPDALMVNTVGDETRLTEWSQAEGRARQSGKGQTSKTIIAPHTRFQHKGEGPLAIRMLRTLMQRSSNSEVSEAFYAHAEQLRGYLRDYYRSGIAEYLQQTQTTTLDERDALAELCELLFIHQCDTDLTKIDSLHAAAKPQEYTDSSTCLQTIIEQETENMQSWIQRIQNNSKLSRKCKDKLSEYINEAYMALIVHQIPPKEALPGGEIGVPRPGEQSFGIVLNTEIAQEQMVEVETEIDMESEISLAKRNADLDNLRPQWTHWNEDWYATPLGLWNALVYNNSDLFVSLHDKYPSLYQFTTLSKNLGFWPGLDCASDITFESDFHWLHDAHVDPFIYHIILEHPTDGFRCLSIAHEEYARYVFMLLCKPGVLDYANDYDDAIQPKISIFRFEGWGWIQFDSTRCALDNTPLTVNTESFQTKRILAECSLLSGNVEIGNIHDQLSFLQLFINRNDETLIYEGILEIINEKYEDYFEPKIISLLEILLQTKMCCQFEDQSTPLPAMKEFLSHCHEKIQSLANSISPSSTMKEFVGVLQKEIELIIGDQLIKNIYQKSSVNAWNSILKNLFGSEKSLRKLKSARQQIKVITSRHRPGIAKKLPTSPMWRLVNSLIRLLENK